MPFLLGVVVGGVGFIVRRRLSVDPPAAASGFPLVVALHRHRGPLLQVIGLSLINAIPFYLVFLYILVWLKNYAGLNASRALAINSINMAIMLAAILAAAWLSDRVGRKPVLAVAAAGLVLFAWPLFGLMQTGQVWAVFIGQLGLALLIGAYGGAIPVAICELFPRGVRCSAVSVAYNITVGIAGGTAPMVTTWLIERTGYALSPALYIMLAAALSLMAVLSMRSGFSAIAAETAALEPAIVRA